MRRSHKRNTFYVMLIHFDKLRSGWLCRQSLRLPVACNQLLPMYTSTCKNKFREKFVKIVCECALRALCHSFDSTAVQIAKNTNENVCHWLATVSDGWRCFMYSKSTWESLPKIVRLYLSEIEKQAEFCHRFLVACCKYLAQGNSGHNRQIDRFLVDVND